MATARCQYWWTQGRASSEQVWTGPNIVKLLYVILTGNRSNSKKTNNDVMPHWRTQGFDTHPLWGPPTLYFAIFLKNRNRGGGGGGVKDPLIYQCSCLLIYSPLIHWLRECKNWSADCLSVTSFYVPAWKHQKSRRRPSILSGIIPHVASAQNHATLLYVRTGGLIRITQDIQEGWLVAIHVWIMSFIFPIEAAFASWRRKKDNRFIIHRLLTLC